MACAILLSAGATQFVDLADPWPETMPPRGYYEHAWESDGRLRHLQSRRQYLDGVRSFYLGTLGVPGWNQRREQILGQLTPEQGRITEPDLDLIGRLVSSEWSKPDPLRRISPKTLSLWGSVLIDARDQDCLVSALDAIRDDTRALLAGGLAPWSITRERYAPMALTKENTR